MKIRSIILLLCVFLFPLSCFSYNYGSLADLPDGVKKLLPENPDILASASADLNGDKEMDYAVIIQYKDPGFNYENIAKDADKDSRRLRELIIITSKNKEYAIAARTKRAVLCSDCGAKDEDPFLELKALTKSFTILHKFNRDAEETWGIAAKFGYSRRDNKWQLVFFSGKSGELKPADFGLINLEDFDVNYYMSDEKVEARPESGKTAVMYPDDILYTENGSAYAIRPDGTEKRYIAGDRFYHQMHFPCWSGDKKQIAYICNNDMFVIGADGANEKRLFRDVLKLSTFQYETGGEITGMRWSPDGRKFAYAGYKDTINHSKKYLYTADLDGKVKVVKEGDKNSLMGSFCWSPDSSKLAYYIGVTLTIMDVNSGSETPVFTKGGSGVAWSGDGKRILTAVAKAYAIIDVDSKNVREVNCLAWAGYGPLYWSKDEKSALYYSSDNILTIQIEDGAKPHTVTGRTTGLIDGMSW
jgi:Tol biopolymer transport system component